MAALSTIAIEDHISACKPENKAHKRIIAIQRQYILISVLEKCSFLSWQNSPDPTAGAVAGFGDEKTTISVKVYWPAENRLARMSAKWHE